jgi:hypothetical protein
MKESYKGYKRIEINVKTVIASERFEISLNLSRGRTESSGRREDQVLLFYFPRLHCPILFWAISFSTSPDLWWLTKNQV